MRPSSEKASIANQIKNFEPGKKANVSDLKPHQEVIDNDVAQSGQKVVCRSYQTCGQVAFRAYVGASPQADGAYLGVEVPNPGID